MAQSFRRLAISSEGTTRVKAPRREGRKHDKFKFGHWLSERAVSSPSGFELSPA